MRTVTLPGARALAVLQLVAAVLFALGQAGQYLPQPDLDLIRPLDSLVRAGNVAVSVILATAGYAFTRRLLAEREHGVRRPVILALVAVAQVVVVLAAVCLCAVLLWALDGTDETSRSVTFTSVQHVMLLDWNIYLAENPLSARQDLAALWVVAVLAQLGALAVVLVVVLGRHRRVFLGASAIVLVASLAWSVWVADDVGWYRASLSTFGHADSFAAGMFGGALAGRLRLTPPRSASLGGGALLALVGAVLAMSFVEPSEAHAWLVAVGALAALVCLAADADPDPASSFVQWTTVSRWSGRATGWVAVLAWAPMAVVTTVRRGEEQHAWLVAAGAVAVSALLVWATVRIADGASQVLVRAVELPAVRSRIPGRRRRDELA